MHTILQKGDTIRLKTEVAKTQVCPKGRENNRTAQIQSFLERESGIFGLKRMQILERRGY